MVSKKRPIALNLRKDKILGEIIMKKCILFLAISLFIANPGYSSNLPKEKFLHCGAYADLRDSFFVSQRKKFILSTINQFWLVDVDGVRYLRTGNVHDTATPCTLSKGKKSLLCEAIGVWAKDDELSSELDQNTINRRKYRIKLIVDLETAKWYEAEDLGRPDQWEAEFKINAGGIKREGQCSNL